MKSALMVILAIFGSAMGDFDGGRGFNVNQEHDHRMRLLPPPYLRNVTEHVRTEYFAIIANTTTTIAQQKEDVLMWAQKYGIEQQVQDFNTNMMSLKNEIRNNVTNLILQLPSAIEQFYTVMDNENLTFDEQMEALDNLCSQNKQQCRIAKVIMKQFEPRREVKNGMMGKQWKHERYGNFENGNFDDVEITGDCHQFDSEFRQRRSLSFRCADINGIFKIWTFQGEKYDDLKELMVMEWEQELDR